LVLSIPLVNNSKAILDGDWYLCNFEEYPVDTTYINESIGGEVWLEIIAPPNTNCGVQDLAGNNVYYTNYQSDTTNPVFELKVNTLQLRFNANNTNANSCNTFIYDFKFCDSADNQIFRINFHDVSDAGIANHIDLFDGDDVLVNNDDTAPKLNNVNITLNPSTNKIHVWIKNTDINNEFVSSNFNYISYLQITNSFIGGGGGCSAMLLYIDNFKINMGASPPDKLWQVGKDVYAGCASCDYDGVQKFSFATTNTIVVESDYDVFVPGRAVLHLALGIRSDSDIDDITTWLRIGDAYSAQRTSYYTYGANHYIIVWENVDTLWYESVLPIEFKFVCTDTTKNFNLTYEHSDNDGDGDIQYKFSMDGDNYNGVYDGDNTMGRDVCIEIYHGWSGIAGDVNISVFNASDTSEALEGWNVTVVNKLTGLIEYNESDCNNVLTINTSDIGIGHRLFYISNESYYTRVYYAYIEPFINYTLNAYLLHEEIGRWYCFRVYSGATEFGYQFPLYDAQINISRFIVGEGLTLVENLFTDSDGYTATYLIPGQMYYFNISKEGYATERTNFVMALNKEDCYEFNLEGIISSGPGYDNWYQNISLEAAMISAGYLQLGNITVNYSDANFSTIDTHTYIYEIYNDTRTFMNYSYDYNNTFDLRFGDINTTRTHHVVLFYNNTATFIDMKSPVVIVLNPVDIYIGERTRFPFDDRIKNIIGPFTIKPDIWHPGVDIPWGNVLAAIIGCIPLVIFGPKHTAIAIIASGIAIGGLDAFFGIWFTDEFPLLLISLAPLLVVLGAVYHKVKGGTL
jgi:hypothetical protein